MLNLLHFASMPVWVGYGSEVVEEGLLVNADDDEIVVDEPLTVPTQ